VVEGRDLDVDAELAEQRLEHAHEPFGRHDHRGAQRTRRRPPEARDAMQEDGRLAVAGLAEHEERPPRRQLDRGALLRRQDDVDERPPEPPLCGAARRERREVRF
jgi:hypothetical protein